MKGWISISNYRGQSRAAGAVSALIGALGLVGWALGIESFKSIVPGLDAIKPNTGAGLILAGVALWLALKPQSNGWARRLSETCAVVVTLAGLLTLGEYVFGWDLGIDELLFRDNSVAVGLPSSLRMAPNAAICFALLGPAILLLDSARDELRRVSQSLAMVSGTIALFALVAVGFGPAQAGHYLPAKAGHYLWAGARAFQASENLGWPINGGVDNIRYSPLTQINRDNVSKLQVAWTYDSHDAFKASEMQSNPVVVDGVLYVTTPTLSVVAVTAATGTGL